jgi:membrane protein
LARRPGWRPRGGDFFAIGKSLIWLYIGHSNIAAGFGAASTMIVVLVWLYYSGLIFLAGAEFTRSGGQSS